ncbi:MAG TPA: APC family permease [Acidimicrobiia bacterium]|nr:APC family permease [Acidimicrobiia bacterium]
MTAQRRGTQSRVHVHGPAGERLGGGSLSTVKRLVVGRPLATHAEDSQLLPKRIALPVFSSDAVSSTAYGTEVMLTVLVPVAGVAAFGYLVPLSLVLIGVLALLVLSYRQTIFAYPNGGGSYIVSRENLGTNPSLVACAALLVDYTLNVAVSAAAGAAAISSAVAPLQDHPVAISVGLVVVIMLANLRGLKEAGRLFAIPVYTYVAVLTLLIVDGLIRSFTGSLHQLPVNHTQLNAFTHNGALVTGITLFALMKAFSSGAVALSGVEAISNGVPAFREPKSRNAAITLMWTGIFLGGPLLGLAVLTNRLRPTISTKETLISLLGDHVFGRGSPLYIILMAAAAGILCLSANTSFADFPRLSSIVARDGFLPHQLARRGDRLVFSNGIIAVAASAVVLLFAFNGSLDSLVPLFAVGLFTAFTLSQVGMVRHHLRRREQGWHVALAINAVGATATTLVLIVILISKFTAGAWIPAVVIPVVVIGCKLIKRHYDSVERALAVPEHVQLPTVHNTVVVPISAVNKVALDALAYARALHPDRLVAVLVNLEDTDIAALRRRWDDLDIGITLDVVDSPYRDITRPILKFINEMDDRRAGDVITVVLPEVVVHHWYHQVLHNQTALALKGRLLFRPNTIVISVPTQIE